MSIIYKRESLSASERFTEVIYEGSLSLRDAVQECIQRRVSLEGAKLNGVDLSGLNLSYVSFKNAQLDGADFTGAALEETDFTNASLRNARFQYAMGQNCKFYSADMRNANLRRADLRGFGTLVHSLTHNTAFTRGDRSSYSIRIEGLRWPVLIAGDYIAIGCQHHLIKDWEEFTDTEVLSMHPYAPEFWGLYKDRILAFVPDMSDMPSEEPAYE